MYSVGMTKNYKILQLKKLTFLSLRFGSRKAVIVITHKKKRDIFCFYEPNVLFGGPKASPGAWKYFMDMLE
jgi:hypothetical protein